MSDSDYSITYDENFESDSGFDLQFYRYSLPSEFIDKDGNMIFSNMSYNFDGEFHVFNKKYVFYFKIVRWYEHEYVHTWDLDFNEEKKEFEVWDYDEGRYPTFYNVQSESFYFILNGAKINLWIDELFTNF